MGYKHIDWAWGNSALKSTEMLVLVCLASHANSKNECWPAINRIADRTRLSRRSIFTSIKKLVSVNLLIMGKHGIVNKYTLQVHHVHPTGALPAPPPASPAPPRAPPALNGCTSFTQTVKNSKLNSNEQSVNKTLNEFSIWTENNTPLLRQEGSENMVSIKDVQSGKSMKDKYTGATMKAKMKVAWRDALTEYHGGETFFVGLTDKELGQLKHIVTKLDGYSTLSSFLTRIVINWKEFIQYTQSVEGLSKVPFEPNIGFILKHISHALGYLRSDNEVTLISKPDIGLSQPKITKPNVIGVNK